MHENSLHAFTEISADNPGHAPSQKELRRRAILRVYMNATRPLRDYDVLQILFPGSTDMNLVRPRITELLGEDKPLIKQDGSATSHTGNRPVRLVKFIKQQLTLFQ